MLDLFCGAGGAAMGYHRAGFEVVGIDHRPQPNYPFEFVQADALGVISPNNFGHIQRSECFDAIHASPPCQAYTRLSVMPTARKGHPDLLRPVIDHLRAIGLPFVVENVDGAPFPDDLYRMRLCGSSFGLRMRRHRWFASNVLILAPSCRHDATADIVGVYGASDGIHEPGFKHPGIRRGPRQATTVEAREVMGMPWARRRIELTNAIPPAYTELIGWQLRTQIENGRKQAA